MHYDGIFNTRNGHNASSTKWEDLSGNNIDADLTGTTWQDNCLSFDGIDDEIQNIPVEEQSDDNISINIVFSDNDNDYARFLTGEGTWTTFEFMTYTGKVYYIGGNYTQANDCRFESPNLSMQTINKDQIYNFTYTYNGASKQVKLYINGELIGTKTYSTSPEDSQYFNIPILGQKKIYNLSIYKKVIDQNEVSKNYEVDKARFNIQEE